MEQAFFDSPGIIKHDSPIPYYFQLSSYVEQKINAREWVPGCLMPCEQDICDKLRISRTVVRQAMAELERKGLVTKQNGKRSTVAYPIYNGSLMQTLQGFSEDAVSKGQKPTTRVLDLRVEPARGEVAEALKLKEGVPVIMINRLRFLNGEPEVLVVTYILESKCSSLVSEDLTHQSLYELLARKYGLVIAQGHRTVQAIALDSADAKLLNLRSKSPALLLKSVGLLENGEPLEFFVAKHRGDRSKFHMNLVRRAKV